MRTNDEIIARIKELQPDDMFGFNTNDLILVLDFNAAKPFLTEGATSDGWTTEPRDRDSVIARMLEYMPFAWDKANNGRGISACRSIAHFMSWIWLAGDDLGDLTNFQFYGKDELCKICAHYGWDTSQWDDGIRTNNG